jgi:5-methyltetrahydrofolate--homocysteine methyltransferase
VPSTRTLLLDAATGTSLLARGLPPDALPEGWLLERPDEIAAVHAAHVAAGAQVVLTCTFNLAAPRGAAAAAAGGLGALAARAVALARAAGAGRVAGALGPVHSPGDEVRRWVAPAVEALAAAGADLLWLESQWVLAEAREALALARGSGLPTAVTLACPDAEPLALPAGAPVEEALVALAEDGAAAVGLNCVTPSPALERLVARVAPRLAVPLVVKPSAGLPGERLAPAEFGARVARLAASGASWLGGCCGAGAEHLAAIAAALARHQSARG